MHTNTSRRKPKLKKWVVTHTPDELVFKDTEIEAATYTDAYISLMCKYPKDTIVEIKEACDG